MRYFALTIIILILSVNALLGQTDQSKKGKRVLTFDSMDVQILNRANDILIDETVWNRVDDRECEDDLENMKYSLFCALYKASMDVLGEYRHRKAGLQQLRFVIQDKYKDRLDNHRLMDFNNHEKTTLKDLKDVISESIQIIQSKKE